MGLTPERAAAADELLRRFPPPVWTARQNKAIVEILRWHATDMARIEAARRVES